MVVEVSSWEQLCQMTSWPAVLLGNGLSIAVDERFRYDALFKQAELEKDDAALFAHLDTQNFETVLRHFRSAEFLYDQVGDGSATDAIGQRQLEVRSAMVAAIRRIHPDWSSVSGELLDRLGLALVDFRSVFTTSYDLILYWALNRCQSETTDHFLPNTSGDLQFDANRDFIRDRTSFRWLHGGLHMYVEGEVTYKTRAQQGLRVLDQIQNGPGLPNIVAEGDYRQKVESIFASDYLSEAYKALRFDEGTFDAELSAANIVVLGHRLGDSDLHLAEALRDRGGSIAYGGHASSESERANTIAWIDDLAERFDWDGGVFYFDSAEHPVMQAVAR